MSYTIVYGRQFVKTTRGIIPLALFGDNNVYTPSYNFRTKRTYEKRERNWNIFCSIDLLELPEKLFLTKIQAAYDEDRENFKHNGKFVYKEGAQRFFQNGAKHALTLEEIFQATRNALDGFLTIYDQPDRFLSRQELHTVMNTTDALERWLDEARKKKSEYESKGAECYLTLAFSTDEPLRIERKVGKAEVTGPVIVKRGPGYIANFTDSSITTGRIENAHVFPSVEAARQQLPSCFIGPLPYVFLSAEKQKEEAAKQYVLRVCNGSKAGYYIQKLTARTLYFSRAPEDAKRFLTDEDALKWFGSKIGPNRFCGVKGVEVVCIKDHRH